MTLMPQVLGSHARSNIDPIKFDEPHDPMHGIKLDKDSNGYCPLCGYWSIATDVIINSRTGEKGDKCQNCDAIFDASELVFCDSQVCKCGHPRSFHDKSYLSCKEGEKLVNCQCKKYEPTEVTVTPSSQKENVSERKIKPIP